MTDYIRATPAALAELCRRADLPEPLTTLRPEPLLRHPEIAAEHADALERELSDTGLIDPDGHPTEDLVYLLQPLCQPSLVYLARWIHEGRNALVATMLCDPGAVCVASYGGEIRFREIHREAMVDALLDQLPAAKPGKGGPASINIQRRREQLDTVFDRTPPREVRYVQRLAKLTPQVQIEITVDLIDGTDRRHTRQPLGIIVTDEGAYYSYATGTGWSEEVHVGPANPATLHTAITALRRELSGD